MDVVWLLGNGSKDNQELRWSMRSFAKNYLCGASPWIIGTIPDWIDRRAVRCIPWPDPYRKNKDANLLNKAIRLAFESELSDSFILCSDDHLLLRPSAPEDFGYWHCGGLPRKLKPGFSEWKARLVNTSDRLRAQGFEDLNFEGHIPYPLRKSWVANAARFDFGQLPGMSLFSTLLNAARVESKLIHSERVRGWLSGDLNEDKIAEKLRSNQFACLDNSSLSNQGLVEQVSSLFPEAAFWENF